MAEQLNNDSQDVMPVPTLLDNPPTIHEQGGLGLPAPIPAAPQYLIDNIVKTAPAPAPAETKPPGSK